MQWYHVDLHNHTPASADYQEPGISFIHILRKAEQAGVDILAFTDHNTVAGYATMMQEIDRLVFLEQLGRAHADELRMLAEYRRLLDRVLVLPGFEFTATFGFHILGIFSPQTPMRQLEHLLLELNIPAQALDSGETEVGASSDVLTAYRLIDETGGICIAAHANASHGVAMRGLDFGGQTRMAYTQDRHLHALEVTDLSHKGRNSTQRFFDGTKPEYPRRMRCIQGSDAHSINAIADRSGKATRLGVGERMTEVLLAERSFDALLDMFRSTDFSRSRPYNPARSKPYDYVQAARDEGPSLVQSFHESIERKGGRLYGIIADVCAFANVNGGTVYVGVTADKDKPPVGVANVQEAINTLYKEISRMITPTLEVEIDALESQGKNVIRIQVPRGEDRPYAIEDNKIYIRDEAETNLAVRDEIFNLVKQGIAFKSGQQVEPPVEAPAPPTPREPLPHEPAGGEAEISPPRAGVEIVGTEQRGDTRYYIMRDLRNGSIVKNVTRSSARRLWHYAIQERETNPVDTNKVQWIGDIGLWKRYERAGDVRYDLVQRANDQMRVYYGVTENGMHGPWQAFLTPDEEDS